RYTKRSNSVQCFDPADDRDAERRLASASHWLEARALPPVMRITPLTGKGVIVALDRLGWRTVDPSHLFAMPLIETEPDPRVRQFDLLDQHFLDVQQRLQNYSDLTATGMRALLERVEIPAVGLIAYVGNEPVASALMDVADAIVVTGNVATDPAYQRQGFAAAVMRTGLAWAYSVGARTAALNVGADNNSAQALYTGLGFRHQYDYSYRIPGAL
ncbi:MAG TPA: GNAT family N-acetyltransferase, partial [Devosia sp.]|nr:GNAT family N-acetyltransferase [Devosia sp.]